MKNVVKYQEGKLSVVGYIEKRIRDNLNSLNVCTGETGIGKTWSMISVAEKVDPNFDAEKQIVFGFKELMELINSEWFKKLKIKQILFDEPQITISIREWQSRTNKMLNYLLSTFRHQNVIVYFATPYMDFLDSASMKLMHCNFECRGVNLETNKSKIRMKILQYNADLKKFYSHSLYVLKDKKYNKMPFIYIPKPSKKSIDIFERRKSEFTRQLNKEILDELHTIAEKSQPFSKDVLTARQEEVTDLLDSGLKVKEIAKKLGIAPKNVYETIRYAKKKGYRPEKREPHID